MEQPRDSTVPGLGTTTTTIVLGESMTPIQRARLFSLAGWRVMPLKPETKICAIKDWPNRATTDWEQLQEWFLWSHPHCDVGILTGPPSGLWVLDIDVKRVNGYASIRDIYASHGLTTAPDTFRVSSPSGGQQWYFRHPPDVRIRNSSSRLAPGLDVRGWHGMVVAPCTFGREVIQPTLPLADAPPWLVDLVVEKHDERRTQRPAAATQPEAGRVAKRVARRLAQVGPGKRNTALNDAAYQLGHLGAVGLLNADEAKVLLLDACRDNGAWDDDGPHGLGQCVATFESGWSAGFRDGRDDAA